MLFGLYLGIWTIVCWNFQCNAIIHLHINFSLSLITFIYILYLHSHFHLQKNKSFTPVTIILRYVLQTCSTCIINCHFLIADHSKCCYIIYMTKVKILDILLTVNQWTIKYDEWCSHLKLINFHKKHKFGLDLIDFY